MEVKLHAFLTSAVEIGSYALTAFSHGGGGGGGEGG
jgi:hypothetical protein